MNYSTVKVAGREHVVCDSQLRYGQYPEPNYRRTQKALCGVLDKGQSLQDWMLERNLKTKGMKIDRSKRFVTTELIRVDFFECPECKQMWVIEEDKYCSNCGTIIEWEGVINLKG